MDQHQIWHHKVMGDQVVASLKKNHFTAYYAATKEAAITHILEQIGREATIGIGGSMTIAELGLDTMLGGAGHTVYNHNQAGLSKEESLALRRKALLSDVFLTSANAITVDGQIVNTDASGNRVAAMLFGPQKVIIIAGINKITEDTDAARQRIQTIAAPVNAKRLNRNTPCVQTGSCMDCTSPERICAVTTIMHKKPLAADIHVVIVGEALGY